MISKRLIINIISRNKKRTRYKIPAYTGHIILNDFREWFYIPLKNWTVRDYVNQWKEGLERIKNHNTSCLISCLLQYKKKNYLNWWVLYREKDTILIQNEMYGGRIFKETFGKTIITHQNCYDFISPYERFTDSGNKISEWEVTLPADLIYETRFFKYGVPVLRKRKNKWAL